MRNIRRGVFETNSSSVHSITMCSKEEFEKFRSGEVLHICDHWNLPNKFCGKEWITPQEAREALLADEYYDGDDPSTLDDDEVCDALEGAVETYNNIGGDWYESYVDEYTTPGGETVVAFGYYGHD